jgi:L-ribulose-5-phosphate 3-epimerase
MKMAIFLDHLFESAQRDAIPFDDALSRARLLGYQGLEITHDPQMNAYSLENRLTHAGLFASALCVRVDFADHPQDMSLAFSALDQCCAMGATRYLVIPGMIDLHDPQHAQMQKDNMVEGLNRLCAEAKKCGVTVVMEDFDGAAAPYATAQGVRYFIDRVPELQVAFDTGNFAYCDEDELDAFELLKDRIAHVHLKDRALYTADPHERPLVTRGGRTLYAAPFGYGIIRGEEILRRLRGIGYDGVLTVEHYGAPRPMHYMEKSAEWVSARIR